MSTADLPLRYVFPESGMEMVRLTFTYDDVGRVVESEQSVAGMPGNILLFVYNEHGDVSVSGIKGQEPFHHEYEYDKWGNWVTKTVRHSSGISEYRRSITYAVSGEE